MSYGLAQPATSDVPNFAPIEPILKYLDQDGQPQLPFQQWFKSKTKELEDQNDLEWRELHLVWELINKFIEGKQILRRRHRGWGWDVIPMPESTTASIREQNKLGFYERVLMEKWVSSRTKINCIAGDDKDESIGAAKAGQVWWDATQDLVFTEQFRQTEAKSGHVHGTYARYHYFDETDESGGYAETPITETQNFRAGEDSAECLDCGRLGLAGEFNGQPEPSRMFGMDQGFGEGGTETPEYSDAGNTSLSNSPINFGTATDLDRQTFGTEGQQVSGMGGQSGGIGQTLSCPDCGSGNVRVEPALEIPIEVQTGTQKHKLGQLKCLSVPYSQIRHEFSCSLEKSPWSRWRRRLRMEEIKAKWPKLKVPTPDATERDTGLEYEEAMRKSTATNTATTRGITKDRKYYCDFTQWWFSPCMYQEYVFPVDVQTVSGETIPAGTKAQDLFPDGMYVATIEGLDAPLQICNESHKWHWVTAPYHLRLFTGLGLGINDAVEMQRQWNVILGLVFTQIRTSAIPGWAYDKDAIEPDSVRKLGQPQMSVPISLRNRPEGTRIEQMIYRMEPGQIPAHIPWYIQQLDGNMQTATGALVNEGVPGTDSKTATGAQLFASASNQHNNPEFALKGQADEDSAMCLFLLAKRHYVEPRYLPLSGKRGKQAGIWLSAADFENGQIKFQAVRDSWLPNSRLDKQESIGKFLLAIGGIEGLIVAMQQMPEFVEQIAQAHGIDIAGDIFEPTALICRQRVDYIKQISPSYAGILPQFQQLAQMQAIYADTMSQAMMDLAPEEQQMIGEIPQIQNPIDMLGDEIVNAVQPEVVLEEPAHMLSVKWLRDLLLDDEMKEADVITRSGVRALIRRHVQLAAQEAQVMAAMAQIANPQQTGEDQSASGGSEKKPPGSQKAPNRKTEMQRRQESARVNGGSGQSKGDATGRPSRMLQQQLTQGTM